MLSNARGQTFPFLNSSKKGSTQSGSTRKKFSRASAQLRCTQWMKKSSASSLCVITRSYVRVVVTPVSLDNLRAFLNKLRALAALRFVAADVRRRMDGLGERVRLLTSAATGCGRFLPAVY